MVDRMPVRIPDDPTPGHRLSLRSIIEAAASVDPAFLDSPQFESEPLSRELGCNLTLKVETANPIRSFKGRGADFFMTKIIARGEDRQLVCASTGNFGQAMAYAGRRHGRGIIVYCDESANPLKVERIRELGADLRREGEDFDSAKAAARSFCDRAGAWMVEDGREPEMSEGAGTIGVELMKGHDFDTILVPVGNGALITGIARWVKAAAPDTTVVGVSAEGADAMENSWRSGGIVDRTSVSTIAEGIAVRIPVAEAVEDMRSTVDEMILVSDESMVEAMRLLHNKTGQLVEPSGAVGVAAVMREPARFRDQAVATILTGNNITPTQMQAWLG